MSLIKRIIKKSIKVFSGCEILYRTNWYKSMFRDLNHETYPDNVWYREHDERNFDLVNLGSSGGKWAFDYTGLEIKAMNWAQQPQTLLEEYNLLRPQYLKARRLCTYYHHAIHRAQQEYWTDGCHEVCQV